MKTVLITCLCSIALALSVLGQNPVPPPQASPPVPPPTASVSAAPVATASAAASISPAAEDDFDAAIEKKLKKHFNMTFDHDKSGKDDVPWIAIPIVLIVFLAIFGTPVMIVALIMYFSFSKSRALHRTVRMMVEKGQPVPEALLNPPPVIRQRSDLRRGVVLLMVGLGLTVFFGAVNDWESGVWSLGIIPFLIGAGYLLVWRLDVRKTDTAPVKEETSPKV
jgi:Domain of unknown function (DUF6249)